MHRQSPITARETSQQSVDRHSIAYQFLGSFLNAIRQSSEIQSMLNDYR
jgi:hypothetical protein